MRRTVRMFLAAGLLSLSALVPANALATGSPLHEYVSGVEYALGTCSGGDTGSFAGYGRAPSGGAPNGVFNTTICHSAFTTVRTAKILAGGSFTLVTNDLTLFGQYTGGTVGPGVVHGNYFCTETFPVMAALGRAGSRPEDATNISSGTAVGELRHYGVRNGASCTAYAATITGLATFKY